MHILALPDTSQVESVVRPEGQIYIGLAKSGIKLTIMTDEEGIYAQRYRDVGITVIGLNLKRKINLQAIQKIHSVIKSESIDIVYATVSKTILHAAFACIGTHAKCVIYRGTTGVLNKIDPTTYLKVLHPRVDGVVCVSKPVTEEVKSKVRKSIRNNVKTIYKGHDLAWYRKPPLNLSTIGVDANQFNVMCIGSYRASKCTRYVLEACRLLADIQDFNLILIGGEFRDGPFAKLIEKSGMQERIILPGYRNDVPQLAASCDLTLLASTREGLPRVVMESLAMGTPVVATASAGSLEVITDRENGCTVPMRDSQAIADKIRFLHQNPDILSHLASNTKSTIGGRLSHQKTVTDITEFFHSLLNK